MADETLDTSTSLMTVETLVLLEELGSKADRINAINVQQNG